MKKRTGLKQKIINFLDDHAGIILSLPALILLFLFVVMPFATAFFDSLTNKSIQTVLRPERLAFKGLGNYQSIFADSDFRQALWNTFYFVVLVVPLQTVLALLFAVIVNGAALWKKVLRTCLFLPVVTSMAVLAVVWSLLYNPSFGVFNAFLKFQGVPAQPFIDSPSQAMNCIIVMSVWQGLGFQMMIFLAGLQTIPPHFYEAAEIESANALQRFWYITLPLLRNTMIFVVFVTTIFAFKLFVQPHLITHGGPQGATRTLILMLYDEAFTGNRYGKAGAVAVVFFVIVIAVSFVQRAFMPAEQKS